MPLGVTKSSADRKPQMTSNTSPTFSTLGRSPSIGPPAYTTDDLLAARYQKFSKWVHLMRVAIAAITFIASIAIIACVGASLRAYAISRLEPEWILPLWPLNVDLRPSHAILGCGIAVALLSLAYLAVAFVPMRQRLHNTNLVSTVLSSLCLCAALFTIIFASVVTNNLAYNTYSGTLNSWTCRWYGFDSVAPSNFTKICNDGMAALDLVIVLVLIEVLAVGATAWGWWVEMRLKKRGVDGAKSEVELV
ncbi:MAG: hypothetical protein ALECFALPRED_003789 [Alectoria fallacina]|uniref:Uncharacterized protein n=1 Tax=Alectoria fallacina TaxID=1903189 RepID=A0A8H3ELG2_9LECA|nr:MAG: hypothetical protein ALECFALPRED_003789 [Alectoria fallacina]